MDQVLAVCFRGGFRRVLLRGDTDFSQTEHLDRWNADKRVHFLFGYDAMANVLALAEQLPERVGAEQTRFVHADGESEGLSDREPSLVEGLGSGGLGSNSASPECCAGNDSLMSGIPK